MDRCTSGQERERGRAAKQRAKQREQRKHTRPNNDTDREEVEAGRPPKKQEDTGTEQQPKEGAPGGQRKTGRRRLHTSH